MDKHSLIHQWIKHCVFLCFFSSTCQNLAIISFLKHSNSLDFTAFVISSLILNMGRQMSVYWYCISCFRSKALFLAREWILTMALFSIRCVFLDFSTFSSFRSFVKFDHFLVGIVSKMFFSFDRILSWQNIYSFCFQAFSTIRKSSWSFSDASKAESSERSMFKSVSTEQNSIFVKIHLRFGQSFHLSSLFMVSILCACIAFASIGQFLSIIL